MSLMYYIIILIFPLILFGNMLLFYIFIKQAIKKHVKPKLASTGLLFVDYKWPGFFSCGDFKNDKMDFAFFKTGPRSLSVYSFIYYKDLDITKQTTIRIDVIDLSIDNVVYSSEPY